MYNTRQLAIFAIISSLVIIVLGYAAIFLAYDLLPPFFSKLLFGAPELFPYSFQMGMWLPFFIGINCLRLRFLEHRHYNYYFERTYLPLAENAILSTQDFKEIINIVKRYAKHPSGLAPRVVQQVILKYRSSKSVEQASSMLSSLLDLAYQKLDLKYSSIRYLSWLIPSLGFMGTVYGISLAVSAVGTSNPEDPALLNNIAANLAVAFDTTLLALIQASILLYIMHVIEGREETSINSLGEYVLEHLINKLE